MNTPSEPTRIGKSVTIHGDLSGNEDLVFDGTLEGTVALPGSRLTVGENARMKGDISVHDLIVYGVVEGNVRAAGRIELRQSAKMNGDLFASRLSIEENASVMGRVELTGKLVAPGERE